MDASGNRVHNGKTVGFFRYLNDAFGWQIRHVQSRSHLFGAELPNGSFTGLIGMVQRQEVDMAACLLSITHERVQAVDFSYPYHYDTINFFTHKPGYVPQWEVLIWPYQLNAWVTIISSFILFSILFYIVFLLIGDNSYSLTICIMECYKQYFGASTHQWPAKLMTRNLFGLWCLMAMIISKAYSGNLLSSLTKRVTRPYVYTIDQLYKSNYHEVVFYQGSMWHQVLASSEHESFRKVYSKFEGTLVHIDPRKALQTISKYPQYVYLGSMEGTYLAMTLAMGVTPTNTFFYSSKESLLHDYHGIAMKSRSKLKECIDEKIIRSQESGLWFKWRSDAMFIYKKSRPIAPQIKQFIRSHVLSLPHPFNDRDPLSLEQMQAAFYIYLGMTAIAGFSFFIEKLTCFKYSARRI